MSWQLPASRTIRVALALTLLTVAACSDGGTGPATRPGIQVVAGGGVSDTIGAHLARALTVSVRDSLGRVVPDVVVRFESLFDTSNPYGGSPVVTTSRLDGVQPYYLSVDTTNADGRASVLVYLGVYAGTARLRVSVPTLGFVDTVSFTIQPGAPVAVRALPADTAVVKGGQAVLRAAVTDRVGNARPDSVHYSTSSSVLSVSGATVAGSNFGRGLVIVTAQGHSDTTFVSVVPPGTLAVRSYQGIAVVNTDGSGFKVIGSGVSAEYGTDWVPDGSAVTTDVGYGSPLKQFSLTGAVSDPTGIAGWQLYPAWSHDGKWLYFSVAGYSESFRLWKVKRDGTGAVQLPNAEPVDDFFGSPSPDDSRMVYVLRRGASNDSLRMLDLTSGAVTHLPVRGHSPRWSPRGTDIAYIDLATSTLRLMAPDASNRRTLAGGDNYAFDFGFSSDGRWIAATNGRTGVIDLIDVDTGMVLPLGFTRGFGSPSWKP